MGKMFDERFQITLMSSSPLSPSGSTCSSALPQCLHDISAVKGQLVVLECRLRGTPPLQVIWYKEDEQVQDSDDFRILRKSECVGWTQRINLSSHCSHRDQKSCVTELIIYHYNSNFKKLYEEMIEILHRQCHESDFFLT